jgi:hypothetical protein
MLTTGNWNMANILAAGGDVALCVAIGHWLNVVSGGLRESAGLPGHHLLTLRELEVAVFQMVRLNAAVQEKTIGTTAVSIEAAAGLLQDCLDEGVAWTVLGSLEAAMALWVSYGRRCSQLRPALWVYITVPRDWSLLRHCTRLNYSVAVSAQSYQSVIVRQFYHRVVSSVLRDAQT